ncbi:MAG: prolyl oligopeptidase family serine peptidase [Proteobacteria bacterium]|nr:prolyl oligopeptidase family serine peptidase [Pseudomonadota bacterium]
MVINSLVKRIFIVTTFIMFTAQFAFATVCDRSTFTDMLLKKGPYGSGVSTIPLVDPTRPTAENGGCPGSDVRTLTTEVWYPAMNPTADGKRDAVPAISYRGFPLIVHAHGLTSNRFELAYAAKHLATHGFVVAAPDFPLSSSNVQKYPCVGNALDYDNQAVDVIFVAKAMVSESLKPIFHVDPERLGLSGISLGGLTVLLAGNFADVDAVAMMAPASCTVVNYYGWGLLPDLPLTKPSMVIHGTADGILPYDKNATPLYEINADPKYLLTLEDGSHIGYGNDAPNTEDQLGDISMDYYVCGFLPVPADTTCPSCAAASPYAPQMPALRQMDLTKVSLLAFFDGYLRNNLLDRFYLKYILDKENDDADVASSGSLMSK